MQGVDAKRFEDPDTTADLYVVFLSGYSAHASHTVVKKNFYVVENGNISERQQRDLASLCFRMMVVKSIEPESDRITRAKPNGDDEAIVQGMSGGMVVGLDPMKTLGDFRVVGVQSKQWSMDGNTSGVGFLPGQTVLEVLKRLLQDRMA